MSVTKSEGSRVVSGGAEIGSMLITAGLVTGVMTGLITTDTAFGIAWRSILIYGGFQVGVRALHGVLTRLSDRFGG